MINASIGYSILLDARLILLIYIHSDVYPGRAFASQMILCRTFATFVSLSTTPSYWDLEVQLIADSGPLHVGRLKCRIGVWNTKSTTDEYTCSHGTHV
jgi:hypothetical protein